MVWSQYNLQVAQYNNIYMTTLNVHRRAFYSEGHKILLNCFTLIYLVLALHVTVQIIYRYIRSVPLSTAPPSSLYRYTHEYKWVDNHNTSTGSLSTDALSIAATRKQYIIEVT